MIYDANTLDIIGERKDGGLELYIISSGEMDDTPESQTLLLDKVQNYLGYISNSRFEEEFPHILKQNIWIIIKFEKEPPQLILELCEKIVPWVEDNGAKFKIEIAETDE